MTQLDADLDTLPIAQGIRAGAAAGAMGRYEGSVKRESDGASFLRAVELGTPSGTSQPIRIYEQVSGGLPPSPQWSGTATALGPFVIFNTSDSVANRKFLSLAFGNILLTTSTYEYHDGRADVKLAGMLKKI